MYTQSRTIVAISTPVGEGGVAMIRISGKEAFSIAGKFFSKNVLQLQSHVLTHGKILSLDGEVIDEVMIAKMDAPKTFTGENTVEIFCHGSLLIQKKIIHIAIAAGANLAMPGEFSYQSFMNGKMDLSQAEAIQELIHAKNDYALKAAENQLQGLLSKKVEKFRQDLIEIAAVIDAWVDYPEEGLEFKTEEEILFDLEKTQKEITQLKNTFQDGQKLNLGIKLCLLGAPNAGKSSLMNALLGYDRAIVTPIAGTTRDLLQEDLVLFGLNFKLIDTAGIRNTEEIIEKEGIKRSKAAANEADLVLYVIDTTVPLSAIELETLDALPAEKTIIVWNKTDLESICPFLEKFTAVKISAKNRIGLDELKKAIEDKVHIAPDFGKDEVLITKERHHQSLCDCLENLDKVISGLKDNVSCEFISFDLRMSLKSLSEIIGFDLSESILDSIFSKFCVGK